MSYCKPYQMFGVLFAVMKMLCGQGVTSKGFCQKLSSLTYEFYSLELLRKCSRTCIAKIENFEQLHMLLWQSKFSSHSILSA